MPEPHSRQWQMRPMYWLRGFARNTSAPLLLVCAAPFNFRAEVAKAGKSASSSTVTRMSASFGSAFPVVSEPTMAIFFTPGADTYQSRDPAQRREELLSGKPGRPGGLGSGASPQGL